MNTRSYTIAILIALASGWPSTAQAQPPSGSRETNYQQIDIHGGSGGHHISVHSAFVTVLYFPTPIINILHSNQQNFIVQAKNDQIVLRPADDAKPGDVTNINVLTDTLKLSIIVVVVERPEEATAQVVFREAPPPPSPDMPVVVSMGGILGIATQLPVAGTSPDDRSLLLGTEARLGMQTSPTTGVDLALAVAQIQVDRMDMMPPSSDTPPFVQSSILARVLAGVNMRMADRLMPRLHAGAGMFLLYSVDRRVDLAWNDPNARAIVKESVPPALGFLLTSGASIGTKLTRHWSAGVRVRITRTIHSSKSGFTSFESGLFLHWL